MGKKKNISQNRGNKKKAKREQKKKLMTQKKQLLIEKNKYPRFKIVPYNKEIVDESFVLAVKEAIKEIDYQNNDDFHSEDILFLKNMKKKGFDYALYNMKPLVNQNGEFPDPDKMLLRFGEILYRKLSQKIHMESYFPIHDCEILPTNSDFNVKLSALKIHWTPKGKGYYSSKEPKVSIGGKEYVLSFSKHALDRIAERCAKNYLSYAGSGDVFAYLSKCTYFEYVEIDNDGTPQPAMTFYDACTPKHLSSEWLKALSIIPKIGFNYYYRIGYCPLAIHKDFARAITFLTPGMNGTPENRLIKNIDDSQLQTALQRSVQNTISFKHVKENKDFSAVKYFHEHGITQVIETIKSLYDYT